MKNPIRFLVLIIIFSLILLISALNWSFVLTYILMPLATTAWLLLRIFILSIDQKYIWGGLVLAVLLMFLYRLGQETSISVMDEYPDENTTIKNVEFWKTFIKYNNDPSDNYRTLKAELQRLIVSMHASNLQGISNFEILELIKRREIALPSNIYDFLFDDENNQNNNFSKKIKMLLLAPRRWMNRLAGREQAQFYASLEEVFSFLESSLEINYDRQAVDPRKH
ncbi:MAG: hypothetical protein LWX83_03490 [Anaerolineae bacterium]|nr:hypothetical protein [Anaerolineae bacterium]